MADANQKVEGTAPAIFKFKQRRTNVIFLNKYLDLILVEILNRTVFKIKFSLSTNVFFRH